MAGFSRAMDNFGVNAGFEQQHLMIGPFIFG